MIAYSSQEADKLLSYMSRTIDDFRHFFKPSHAKEHFDVALACQEAISLSSALLKVHTLRYMSLYTKAHTSMGIPMSMLKSFSILLLMQKRRWLKEALQIPLALILMLMMKEHHGCV